MCELLKRFIRVDGEMVHLTFVFTDGANSISLSRRSPVGHPHSPLTQRRI